jgi:hypothetical protein
VRNVEGLDWTALVVRTIESNSGIGANGEVIGLEKYRKTAMNWGKRMGMCG